MAKINMELLDKIVPQFRKTIDAEGQEWQKDREERAKFLAEYFSKGQIAKLDEGTLRELIHMLWAFSGWTNKDYLLQEMLKSTLDTIKQAFLYLLHSDDSIDKRFDYVEQNVKRMGPAGISEILLYHDHTKYPIWNRRSKTALLALGIDNHLLKRPHISGSQYREFCELVRDVHSQVVSKYPEVKDLFDLDFLLYYISKQEGLTPPSKADEAITPTEDFDHDEVINQILKLGDGLGFEFDKEVPVLTRCRIDAIWRARIANLGVISYAFEVHRRGDRKGAILNLQRVCRDPSIQKVVIVSTEKELTQFKEVISTLGEDFRKAVAYFKVDDLQLAVDHLESLKGILNTIGLLSVKSLFD